MDSARALFRHEVNSLLDGTKQLSTELRKMHDKASHPELRSKVDDLRTSTEEQHRRLEEIFGLMGEEPQTTESLTLRGFVGEVDALVKQEKPDKEPMDVYLAHTASDIAAYLTDEYESMLLLAERSGVNHASPKVSDLLKVSGKETKKIGNDIHKLVETLVEQLRPS